MGAMSFDALGLVLSRVPDAEVMARLTTLVQSGRRVTVEILVHLAEIDSRRLHLGAGYNSLFAYCVGAHGMSEDEACRRIEVARLGTRFNAIWSLIASGDLSLSVAALLKVHLTEANQKRLLAAVSGKSVRAAREELAALFPMPDVPSSMRKLSQRGAPPSAAAAMGRDASVAVGHELPSQQLSLCHARDIAGTDAALVAVENRSAEASELGSTEAEMSGGGDERPFGDAEMLGTKAATRSVRHAAQQTEREGRRLEVGIPLENHAQRNTAAGLTECDSAFECDATSEGKGLSQGKAPSEGTALMEAEERQPSAPAARARANVSSAERARLEASAVGRYRVQFTIDSALKQRLELALDLMAHQNPARDFAVVVGRGLELLVDDLLRRRMASTGRPRPGGKSSGRRVRSETRRAVVERDGLRCTFVSAAGRRCEGRAFLEFDHERSFAQGGDSELGNVRLLCRSHNRYCAELAFGAAKIAREIERSRRG
jgi:hypothetical protein